VATTSALSIAQAARASGVSTHTLRYYERAGVIHGVDRAGSGHRRYEDADLAWIRVVQRLRATGMPIRTVRRYAELVRDGHGNERERLALLREHRDSVVARLAEVQSQLAFVNEKIAIYEETIDG
jgi:DNA-binding transcriptional MerR regulator